ncbi:major capsid family protein [Paraburkholderia tropica]|uniref:major capsid family protein n=1 Tax=Paraburkholderia tropica TaxID=92647 RepID=UPI002AB681A7|nr:major capsid family protein [Paraburkholderia tropica]
MDLQISKVHSTVSGRQAAALRAEGKPLFSMDSDDVQHYVELKLAGLGIDAGWAAKAARIAMDTAAMDDPQGGVFTATIGTPVQFLQEWLPGMVRAAFAIRQIDEIVGISTVGQWHFEEVVQAGIESMGDAVPYGDMTNVPLADYNMDFERRTIVRFEKGFAVGRLEEARARAIRVSAQAEKRIGVANALDIQRNLVGFNGYNSGADRTYGFLNDPGLLAYTTVANGATSGTPGWSTKTTLDIIADLLLAFKTLEVQSGGNIQPKNDETTLVLPTGFDAFLGVPTTLGYSVNAWLGTNYPKCRIVTAPQLASANGGSNVFYLFADKMNSEPDSTDDGRTWMQAVPAKFQTLGVMQESKRYVEDFTNASAGVMCKRPLAVTRWSGI